jgi:hypothetical protein
MRVGGAKAAAARWVEVEGRKSDHFLGAYLAGSVVELPDEAELAEFSDVDVMVVYDVDEVPPKPGKFRYGGALLEVTYLPWKDLAVVEEVLASHHLANSLRADTLIADPTGRLGAVQAQVARHFAERTWVRRRCRNVLDKIDHGLRHIDPTAPFYDQVTAWLFPTGITTHVLLLAALRNPTVRRRYLAARQALRQYGRLDGYPPLLGLLGCERLTPDGVAGHLDALAVTFDAAAAVARTPFPFSSDITPLARPIAIDGSRAMIAAGDHREAVFWIAATFARCCNILAADAPDLLPAHLPALRALAADLGVGSPEDIASRAGATRRSLPALWALAEDILARNPEVLPG